MYISDPFVDENFYMPAYRQELIAYEIMQQFMFNNINTRIETYISLPSKPKDDFSWY